MQLADPQTMYITATLNASEDVDAPKRGGELY